MNRLLRFSKCRRATFIRHLSNLRNDQSFLTQQKSKFEAWRRENALYLIATGGVLGALSMAGAFYVFILDNPKAIEKLVVNRTANAFSKALTYEARKKIYFGLPDVVIPSWDFLFRSSPDILDPSQSNTTQATEYNEDKWVDLVSKVLDESGSSFILMAKALMRRELVSEACKFPTFEERLAGLRELLPYPSIERDILVQDQIEAKLNESGWLDAQLLEENPPSQVPTPSCDPLTRVLIASIAVYPGSINRLIQYLDETHVENSLFKARLARHASTLLNRNDTDVKKPRNHGSGRSSDDDLELTKKQTVFFELRHLYRDLLSHQKMRDYVLQQSLSTTIEMLSKLGHSKPYALYVKAIDEDLLGPLRRDARVTEDILDQVKRIFLAAPPEIQARILLTALRHPFVKETDVSPDEQAKVVRDLLSAGGVVAVKLGQMLAEDPKIPINYRTLLGDLRDDNDPMSACEFWHAIPQTIRKDIVALGPCLGVGSVKQVHRCKFRNGKELAVCVLRRNVEDEALSSLNALEASQELGVVAKRLGRLVFGEFNLFSEGEALGDFSITRIGRHPKFRVVKVFHHSPKCLVEEIAKGPTLAKALATTGGEESSEFPLKKVKDVLTEYHQAVFSAFVYDGLIHSDIHLGNAILENKENGLGLVLYDVGQFDKIGLQDTISLLWVLGSISSIERRITLRQVAMNNLQRVCNRVVNETDFSLTPPEKDPELRKALEKSYDEAIAPFEDGTFPDQRQAYMLFLRACERNGVSLPKGAFSVAKMIDGMLSQCQQFRLHNVAQDAMEAFLRKHMSWYEFASIMKGSLETSIAQSTAIPKKK